MPSPTSDRARSSTGAFFGWWQSELRGLMPRRGSRRPRLRSFLVALFDGDRVHLARRRGRRVDELGSLPLHPATAGRRLDNQDAALLAAASRSGLPVILRLSSELGLLTSDVLPGGAARDLQAIIAHKLDLLTPWSVDQVYFDACIEDRRDDGRIEVAIAVARRPLVDTLCTSLEAMGLKPRLVDLVDDEDPYLPPRFDLLSGQSAPARTGLAILLGGLLLAGLLGGGTYAGHEIWSRGALIAQRESFAHALEARLDDMPILRERLEELHEQASFIVDRRHDQPSAVVTIEALSRLLPDNVWLNELSLEGDRLVINGHAGDANMLIPLLEDAGHFAGVEFRAAVTRVRAERGAGSEADPVEVDRFALGAQVLPRRDLGSY